MLLVWPLVGYGPAGASSMAGARKRLPNGWATAKCRAFCMHSNAEKPGRLGNIAKHWPESATDKSSGH